MISFSLQQIQSPFKLVATPLTNFLIKAQRTAGEIKFGFMTLDQN